MKNIVVTGGAGYIGSILVPELLQKGYRVTVIDNFLYKQNSLANVCHNPNFQVIKGDVRNKQIIVPLISKADIIIPLAALVGAPITKQNSIGATSINLVAMHLMLDKISKDQIVVMPTTNSAYGTGDNNNFCTEESELRPISQYATHKVEIEKRLMEFENSISLRLATVFGMSPRMRIDLLVNDFTYRAVKEGAIVLFESHFKRNYIHVRDVARAFIHVLDNHDSMRGEIYNVGLSDANLSKLELCEAIKKHVPNFIFKEENFSKDPDQRNYIVSNNKIEKTGYETAYTLDMGIEELVKGYTMLQNTRYNNI
jgi:nucleoside-diphosphate-sugar epimerase